MTSRSSCYLALGRYCEAEHGGYAPNEVEQCSLYFRPLPLCNVHSGAAAARLKAGGAPLAPGELASVWDGTLEDTELANAHLPPPAPQPLGTSAELSPVALAGAPRRQGKRLPCTALCSHGLRRPRRIACGHYRIAIQPHVQALGPSPRHVLRRALPVRLRSLLAGRRACGGAAQGPGAPAATASSGVGQDPAHMAGHVR